MRAGRAARLSVSDTSPCGSRIAALDVEHEHRLRPRGGEQVGEVVEAPPGRREGPAIPVERQRAGGLQVAELEPPAAEVEIGLDHIRAGALGRAQPMRLVAGAMRDQQWCVDHVAPPPNVPCGL